MKHKITIGGKEVEISSAELKKLHEELAELLGEKEVVIEREKFVPWPIYPSPPPIYIQPAPFNPYPICSTVNCGLSIAQSGPIA